MYAKFQKKVGSKVAKLKLFHKTGSLTQPCKHRYVSFLPLISKVIGKVIRNHASALLALKKFDFDFNFLPFLFD